MDSLQKLAWVSAETRFEADGEPHFADPGRTCSRGHGYTEKQIRDRYGHLGSEPSIPAKGQNIPIFMATGGGGRRVPLLKAMLTTACERNCNYCAFRARRNYRRVTFKPDELAKTFFNAYHAGWVDGLFLSTGLFAGGPHTQDKLIDTATILREKLGYRGYLHLKIMPGVEFEQVRRAMQFANRVSANLEAPNQARLTCLAPQKDYSKELLQPLLWAEEIRTTERYVPTPWSSGWASTSTQFVVGPAGESDLELLSTVTSLFTSAKLRRAYFEAFNPIVDTPFENLQPEKPLRQHRLYQASYLLRDYGFDLEDLPFQSNGQLPENRDPKQAYADRHYHANPLELNRASREQLLRIPGIGLRSVEAIIGMRKQHRLSDLGQLRRIGILAERTAPYILLDGKRPLYQKALFAI
jgi:predicted DNA-binding helix-hairpin-helix protein